MFSKGIVYYLTQYSYFIPLLLFYKNLCLPQIDYQKQLIECYSAKCCGDFPSLEDDGYVHKKLLYHIADSGKWLSHTEISNFYINGNGNRVM